jgi:4-amino-4-deoxy-L-arabinose transferase-like glycosyltransferase
MAPPMVEVSPARPGLSRLAAVPIVAVLGALLAFHSADPWRYLHDDNGRRYSSYARTHLVLGLGATGGRDFFFDPRAGRLVPYGHHPSGLGLLLAAWFRLTGDDGPRTARALPAIFHLVSVLFLLDLLRRQYARAPALMAALALALVPMSSYFGKLVNFEPLVLPLTIGLVVAYWRWAEGGGARWLAIGLALSALGSLIDWPMPLFLALLGCDAVRRWRRGDGTRFLGAGAAACAAALMLVAAVAAWVSGPVGAREMTTAVGLRLLPDGHYAWWELAGKVIDYNRRYFTEPVLAASVVAAWLLVRDVRRHGRLPPRARLLALFGALGIVPVLAFPGSAVNHAYWQFYLLPYEILSLAYVLERLGPHLSRRSRAFVYAGVACWLVAASAFTLRTRYAKPSGYVVKRVRQFDRYL